MLAVFKSLSGQQVKSTSGSYPIFLTASVLFLIFLRIISVYWMGLMPQDAYYFLYSQNLALSYFDHPPVLAYTIRMFTTVFGENTIALKLTGFTLTLISALLFYKLSAKYLSVRRAHYALMILLSTSMASILSLVVTPDIPLMLFWIVSLIFLHKAIFESKGIFWLLAGISMGLAFDSKYTGIFLPIGLISFLLLSKQYRPFLFTGRFLLSILVFLIISLPVIIWNYHNHFASFHFQGTARFSNLSALNIRPTEFLGFIGHQSFLLSPVLLIAIIFLLIRLAKKFKPRSTNMPATDLFLLCFFVPLFAGFFILSPFYWVKINWAMPAYLTAIILVCKFISHRWVTMQLLAAVVIHICLAIEIFIYPVNLKSDDTWVGWKELSEQVKQEVSRTGSAFVFSADGYKTSAILNFYLGSPVYAENIIRKPSLQFDYLGTDINGLKNENALFVNSLPGFTKTKQDDEILREVANHFKSVKELNPIIIYKDDKIIRLFAVYECKTYMP